VARVGQARKRDANEPEIVQALRKSGSLVQRVSERGFCDLICQTLFGRVVLLEVKSKGGTLTKAQRNHTDGGWKVTVVRTVDDALKACR
jgi:hypothetical protein